MSTAVRLITRGHESLLRVISENERPRQFVVPNGWESRVRLRVEDYRRARKLMEGVSRMYRGPETGSRQVTCGRRLRHGLNR